ncbi:MAG: helix-turn-helix domain-containing protein [Deferrisomatales bacterium]
MNQRYTTAAVPESRRASYWRETIAAAYFPLELQFARAEEFQGELSVVHVGELSLSRLRSAPVGYFRRTGHLAHDAEECFLLSLPLRSAVEFSQCGRRTVCPPGSFVLERSGEPYEFVVPRANELQVLKVPEQALRWRIAAPDRLCALRLDAGSGAGALFVEFLQLAARRLPDLDPQAAQVVARQILDLLAVALEAQQPVGESEESAVRTAHRRRIEAYIRRHLADPRLSPSRVAEACGVSVRYLHRLFQPTGRSVSDWIRELRLQACREALLSGGKDLSLGDLAYRWGFSDQAHFSRAFKARFGIPPSQARRRASTGT